MGFGFAAMRRSAPIQQHAVTQGGDPHGLHHSPDGQVYAVSMVYALPRPRTQVRAPHPLELRYILGQAHCRSRGIPEVALSDGVPISCMAKHTCHPLRKVFSARLALPRFPLAVTVSITCNLLLIARVVRPCFTPPLVCRPLRWRPWHVAWPGILSPSPEGVSRHALPCRAFCFAVTV